MKNNPVVDILLTYWGDPELFHYTVESVLAQSSPNWRLLIFDDCYPSDLAQTYIATLADDRITYFRHIKNIGITANFNYAINNATSEYCILIGCDDIMLPNYIETAISNIGTADFYQPGVDVINEDGKVYLPLGDRIKRILHPKKSTMLSGEKLATSLCHGNWLYFPSILWKTNTIKKYGFNTKYKIVEDVILELNIIKDNGTLYFDTTTTFQYRRFSQSLSSIEKSKDGIRFSEENAVYNDMAKIFKNMGWNNASRAAKWRITSRINSILS